MAREEEAEMSRSQQGRNEYETLTKGAKLAAKAVSRIKASKEEASARGRSDASEFAGGISVVEFFRPRRKPGLLQSEFPGY